MFCYVECQAGCFDWLCFLLPDCPSAPSLHQMRAHMVIQRAGWSMTSKDYCWMFGSVVFLFITIHHSLHNKGPLFFYPPCMCPLQTNACLYKIHLLRADVVAMHGESLHRTRFLAFGSTTTFVHVWTFLHRHEQAESLMTRSCPAHLYIGNSLRMYNVLIVTQQVTGKWQMPFLCYIFLR